MFVASPLYHLRIYLWRIFVTHIAGPRFSVAPMLDWTDRHCRVFHRCLSQQALLYTEMVTTGAILHGNAARHLDFDPAEHPVSLQLGGSDPNDLAKTVAYVCEHYDYDEINLNVGCPSDRVQNGRFGACLMAEPDLVATCIASMQKVSTVPVTVKCRIGIDDQDEYHDLKKFIQALADIACPHIMIHARKAWLKGLSPKENRDIPPLNYDLVYQIKQEFPDLHIGINGGITDLSQARQHLNHVDEVMIGRAAFQNPYLLSAVDQTLFNSTSPIPTRHQVIANYIPYVQRQLDQGTPLHHLVKPILGLFNHQKGGRQWRRILSTYAQPSSYPKAPWGPTGILPGIDVIEQALSCVAS